MLPYVFRSFQGFLGDPARCLGEDATLGNVLQTLDEHYGIVMTFDTLSKELYSLKQGMGENVAEFGVCLSQQSSDTPDRVSQQNPTGACTGGKQDHFYEGLIPEYQ